MQQEVFIDVAHWESHDAVCEHWKWIELGWKIILLGRDEHKHEDEHEDDSWGKHWESRTYWFWIGFGALGTSWNETSVDHGLFFFFNTRNFLNKDSEWLCVLGLGLDSLNTELVLPPSSLSILRYSTGLWSSLREAEQVILRRSITDINTVKNFGFIAKIAIFLKLKMKTKMKWGWSIFKRMDHRVAGKME